MVERPVQCPSLLFRNSFIKKPLRGAKGLKNWVQGLDLNQGPSGYEPDELPDCSTLHQGKPEKWICERFCQ